MGVVDLVVRWRAAGTSAFIELKDLKSVRIKRGSDSKNSKAEIQLSNPNRKHIGADGGISQINFGFDDELYVYTSWNTIDATNPGSNPIDLLFAGFITKVEAKQKVKASNIKITATDKTDVLLAKAKVANYKTGHTSSTIVTNLIQQADYGVYSAPSSYDITTTTDSVQYYSTHKPVIEHIKAVSVPSKTGFDRNAIFYIDENNKFWWLEPKESIVSTLNGAITSSDTTITLADASEFPDTGVITIENESIYYSSKTGNDLNVGTNGRGYGSPGGLQATAHANGVSVVKNLRIDTDVDAVNRAQSVSIGKSTDNAVNMLIMRLGKDLKGRQITTYKYDEKTKTSKLRMKIMDWKHISEQYFSLFQDGQSSLTSDWTPGVTFTNSVIAVSDGTKFNAGGGHLAIGSGEKEIIEYASVSGNNITIAGEHKRGLFGSKVPNTWSSETAIYDWTTIVTNGNTYSRDAIISLGKDIHAETWFLRASARWKGQVTVRGMFINPQEMIELNAPDIGVNYMPLRIKDITHNIMKSDWTTTLKLEEDEPKT